MKQLKSIKTKMIILFGGSLTVLLVVMGATLNLQTSNSVRNLTEEYLQIVVDSNANAVRGEIEGLIEQAKMLSQTDIVKTMNYSEVIPFLQTMKIDGVHDSLTLVNKKGDAETTDGAKFNAVNEEQYKEVVQGDKDYIVSQPFLSFVDNAPIIAVAHSITNNTVKVGSLNVVVNLGFLTQIANRSQIGETGKAWVIDGDGLIISHPNQEFVMNLNVKESAQAGFKDLDKAYQAMEEGKTGTYEYTNNLGEKNLLLYQDIPNTSGWHYVISINKAEVMNDVNAVRLIVIVSFLIIILITLLLSFLIAGSLSKEFRHAANVVSTIAKGDFTTVISDKTLALKDETGVLMNGINEMQKSMIEMLGNVRESASGVSSTAEQTSSISEEMTSSAQSQSSAMNEMIVAMEEITNSINEVANGANKLAMIVTTTKENGIVANQKVLETVRVSEKGKENMAQLTKEMEIINETTGNLSKSVIEAGDSTAKIRNIIGVIENISSQTNLLALNASIEAARAGEAGRGFAVVADEIRTLAEDSARATQNIAALIGNVEGVIQTVVKETKENVDKINESSVLVHDVGGTFDEIFKSVEETQTVIRKILNDIDAVNEVAQSVASASQEQSASGEEIVATAHNVNEMSAQVALGSEEVAKGSENLAHLSAELNNQVSRFKII